MKLIKLHNTNAFSDKRGELVELRSDTIRRNMRHLFVSYTKLNCQIPRGNHYHKYKNEWFYVIQGKMRMRVKDLKTGMEEEYNFSDRLKKFIHIRPNLVHTFWNAGKNDLILLSLVDRKFNKKKPDTYTTSK
jgi:dTDP-4-dehydrorhamnose 3,5-epimerase-like enzyme